MSDRLQPLDVSFLSAETPNTPLHVGGLAILEPAETGLDVAALRRRVEQRIALVPRFRRRVRWVPGGLSQPVWVDDSRFDLAYHVRRTGLPTPGTDAQLHALVGRLMSTQLDRSRPLWELYLVEGLKDKNVAVVAKSHPALVDGVGGVDLLHVLLDDSPATAESVTPVWRPDPEPGPADLMLDAAADLVRHPIAALTSAGRALGATGTGLLAAARPAPASPLSAEPGRQRRFATARTDLDQYRKLRAKGTVNDVVLATVAGALRAWLLYRGAPVPPDAVLRALVPTSVRGGPPAAFGGDDVGSRVATSLIDLPIGEPNPTVRLTQIAYSMRAHAEPGRRVGADALVRLSGFAPATLNAMAARAASGLSRRLFNLVVTNAPGPQRPLYVAGARLREIFPFVPLAAGQAVAIGVTSYDGHVYYGLNADWDAMADVDVLAALLNESIDELTEGAP
ncbi:wax ester/triacylglycerol synthase family O-acyltransferase [Cryptosporangium phraense]|uniref:Diacylglycerol O-acyltransferase n=1 Tax=Cryptosporangium phraense TaxID=2593070 RepID=A0A545ANN5_9ACTN|nr:wax ester/triacylglycerol synthase family O-acyltransferase [Cryptosporangium phraense]TQS42890.1 wax ester/triacylglycerol synthase family O-acyltransferase [Cryptosporangium phraense]